MTRRASSSPHGAPSEVPNIMAPGRRRSDLEAGAAQIQVPCKSPCRSGSTLPAPCPEATEGSPTATGAALPPPVPGYARTEWRSGRSRWCCSIWAACWSTGGVALMKELAASRTTTLEPTCLRVRTLTLAAARRDLLCLTVASEDFLAGVPELAGWPVRTPCWATSSSSCRWCCNTNALHWNHASSSSTPSTSILCRRPDREVLRGRRPARRAGRLRPVPRRQHQRRRCRFRRFRGAPRVVRGPAGAFAARPAPSHP